MKKNIVVLFAVMFCLIASLGAHNRHRHRGGGGWHRGGGGWHRGGGGWHRGGGYGSAFGGAALGLGVGMVAGSAMANSNNSRAEIEQLRRDRENDRYENLRREQDQHAEAPKRKGKRILERQLQELEEERALKKSQLSVKNRQLAELDEQEDAAAIKSIKKLKKQISTLKNILEQIEAEMDLLEAQLADR